MKLVRPSGQERDVPRGVRGGAEISEATAGSHGIYLGRYTVPAGTRSRARTTTHGPRAPS